jgi:ATP-dependent DNA helicase DinG
VPGVPALSRADSLKAAVAAAFAPDGALARTLDGFEPREGQRVMAEAVCDAFEAGRVLLAEAGTGTGKTLAYLVPAILSRHRVLVSTGTKNLQEQVLDKDLPVLRRALGVPFTATCLKGRGNYLCLHRFASFTEDPRARAGADRIHLTLIEDWATRTTTGDRAELEELPDDVPFWGEISATSENCIGSECPRYSDCFVTRMRQRAAESDLVIVNHHLLCADAALRQHAYGEVIPDCAFAVIDEAHQLEDVATQYFGITASNYRVDELVRDGLRLLGARVIPDREVAADVRAALGLVERQCPALFAQLAWNRPGGRGTAIREGGLFDERIRLGPELLEPYEDAGTSAIDALAELQASVAKVNEPTEDVRALGRRAGEMRDELGFLLRASDAGYVYYLEVRGRGVFLRATPIDVSAIVRELLVERWHSAVLTSATLAVGGSFAYARARLGVRSADEVQLPSEFDYARQSVLYLPRRMPDPRSEAFVPRAAEQIVEILTRTEGRAFVLFTSHANLRAVQPVVAASVPYPLLVQGTAPRSVLLAQFRTTPNAVLLATSSFWQGVDVIGEALSCVIIDKLPFASPADPVIQARMEAIAAEGGDPFGSFQVPLAILTLLQGLGRLLRHRDDRGVLAILDPRLKSMGYGRRFLASLPPSPIVHDLEAITRFFEAHPEGGGASPRA